MGGLPAACRRELTKQSCLPLHSMPPSVPLQQAIDWPGARPVVSLPGGECKGDMKPIRLVCSVLFLVCGCSLGEAQATRRVGLWEGHPEFRACIRQAVPTQVHYAEVYKACLGLEEEDDQAMECVKDKTPLEDLLQVKMCQRQLRDQVAYGTPNRAVGKRTIGDLGGTRFRVFRSGVLKGRRNCCPDLRSGWWPGGGLYLSH